jgi:Flp pilus assembly protein TadG
MAQESATQNIRRKGWAHLGARVVRALRDRRGGTAVLFAVSFSVLAPLSLGVVDVYMSTEQRAKLQDALDAATLYAARSTAQTNAAIDAQGDTALKANLQLISGAKLKTSDFQISGSEVVAQATVNVPAFALSASHDITVNSTVQRGLDKLEVALVLDNTGSMAGNKIDTLKTQAVVLINKLVAGAKSSSDPTPLRISLVPFSNTVRVQATTDLSNYSTSTHSGGSVPDWVDGRARSHSTGSRQDIFDSPSTDRFAMLKNIKQSWSGCVETRMAPYDIQEDAPTTSNLDTMFTPWFWPDEPDPDLDTSAWPKKRSRDIYNDYIKDVIVTDPVTKKAADWQRRETYAGKYVSTASVKTGAQDNLPYNYGPNAACDLQPVIRLTADSASVITAINNMKAEGDTNIPLGLMWGWHTLTPNKPFADGSPYETQHLKKIVILMTDGDNTYGGSSDANISHYGALGFIWQKLTAPFTYSGKPNQVLDASSSDDKKQAYMDSRLATLCQSMKDKGIVIFTIRVEVTTGSSTLLQNCASSPSNFFNVQNVSSLGAAFDTIAADIADLHLSK